MIKVHFPKKVGGNTLELEVSSIDELLSKVDPRLNSRFVNIFVNNDDIRFLNNKDTKLNDGDEVTFIPAIAGGV